MRIGIFFGGKSREREVSFAGGRTVYDLLDKNVFFPVPIFVDSLGNFIQLDWQYLYKGTIRDFYPEASFTEPYSQNFNYYIENLGFLDTQNQLDIISKVGKKINPEEFSAHFDLAFLALHGPYGEDGSLQGIFEYYGIPYTGSGIFGSAIGIDKALQKKLMHSFGFLTADSISISKLDWMENAVFRHNYLEEIQEKFKGGSIVIKPASQGSSIGISILHSYNSSSLSEAIYKSFFKVEIAINLWKSKSEVEKIDYIQELIDINAGIGLPLMANNLRIEMPEEVLLFLNNEDNFQNGNVILQALESDHHVLVEKFIKGREFSCIVIEDDLGNPMALPPTEIIKKQDLFDFRAKYLPGISRKVTPIELPKQEIQLIREKVCELYTLFNFEVYARIDGIYSEQGEIFLNDPNTTSGMMPSSFFFHQAAEIGLNPSQFLTYIIYQSLKSRLRKGNNYHRNKELLSLLDSKLSNLQSNKVQKKKVAVVFGGNSTERHISVESGRNVYEKLSSTANYEPVPFLLEYHGGDEMSFFKLPYNLMLKDNADDILYKSKNFIQSDIIKQIIDEAKFITQKFGKSDYEFIPKEYTLEEISKEFTSVFIGLHGRPGEDGTIQKALEQYGLAYNGSGILSSATTIDKYATNEHLSKYGLLTPKHILVNKSIYETERSNLLHKIGELIHYPLIAKPSDDGCSSAVKKINSEIEFINYCEAIFRNEEILTIEERKSFNLTLDEEFPIKTYFVVEELISPNGADHFIEITGGMLTSKATDGSINYEIFEPSETLASKGILSLEEKFLAGEGMNITPARYSKDKIINDQVSKEVRENLKKAAMILGVEGYCRIDAFVRIFNDKPSETIFIEVNSLPGLTPATCIFHQAALNHYKPSEFLEKILDYGYQNVKNPMVENHN